MDRSFDYLVDDALSARVDVGTLVRVPFGARRVRGVVVAVERRVPDRRLERVAGPVLDRALLTTEQIELWEWLALRYCAPRGRAYARAVPARVRVSVPEPLVHSASEEGERLAAYAGGERLLDALRAGGAGAWCLRTVAGEDRAALVSELVGAAGDGAALVAVPEVRFGSSVLDGLARRWPEIARVDSERSDRERATGWLRLARGHSLGAGGRAAVLAPSPRLRLIVVDEEHDPALKEDRSPRFHARRVALERARLQGAVCVLVSATPSVETGAARAWGRIEGLEPARAAERAARPNVELVEPARERVLSTELHRGVAQTLAAGGRAALLVPGRGFARTVWCADCKRSLRCPLCETGLAYDRGTGGRTPRLRCPGCTVLGAAPDACPTCGALRWRYLGAGSERLAEQVRKAWPRARVARADADAGPARPGDPSPDVYVTTWFGTKPSLRPDVTFVGVVDADWLIRRPDFRAAENAYQALAEMAEWAGPASAGGRLLVQSSEPGHHSIQAVARADYGFFLRRELEQRAELGYPPFAELIDLSATGTQAADVMAAASTACRRAGARVLGPVADPARRGLRSLVKCKDAGVVARGLRDILAGAPAGTRLRVDVDPR